MLCAPEYLTNSTVNAFFQLFKIQIIIMAPPSNIPYGAPVSTWRTTTYPALSPNRPELSAKGKTLVVTGGGSGIGAETAMFFAEAGVARIALLGRREQPLLDTKAVINKKFPQVEVFTASTDIKKKDQVDSAFAKFAGNGKVDVLISGACDNGPVEGIADVNPEEFIESVSSNVAGATYISQAFLRHAAKDAVVVNVSSCGMHLNFGPYLAAYGVIKQAVYRIWDCVGVAKPDMSVFHIQPGVVDTDMNRAVNGIKALGMEDNGKSEVYA
jgi:NAD(P)-dependent dehydrogenase (short-subunit alcohol dehydrogenase family)